MAARENNKETSHGSSRVELGDEGKKSGVRLISNMGEVFAVDRVAHIVAIYD